MNLLIQAKQISLTGKCDGVIPKVSVDDVKSLTGKDFEILHKIMIGPHVGLALFALQNAGFFDWLIPEIQEGLNLKSSKQFKEIWPHTIKVVSQTPAEYTLRWAALFHDLGKAQAFSIKNGKVTFHHHEKISAKIFDSFAKKARIFTNGKHSHIRFLISNLGYAESYESNWTDSAVRRFAKEMGHHLNDILQLSRSDITTANPKKHNKILNRIQELKERIAKIAEIDNQPTLLPKGLGNVISEQLNIPKGPIIGEIKGLLESKIKANEILPNENFDYYIMHLKSLSTLDLIKNQT